MRRRTNCPAHLGQSIGPTIIVSNSGQIFGPNVEAWRHHQLEQLRLIPTYSTPSIPTMIHLLLDLITLWLTFLYSMRLMLLDENPLFWKLFGWSLSIEGTPADLMGYVKILIVLRTYSYSFSHPFSLSSKLISPSSIIHHPPSTIHNLYLSLIIHNSCLY